MFIHMCIYFYNPFATFMQATQQIYVAEEWVRNARDEIKAKAHSHLKERPSLSQGLESLI